MFPIIKGGGTMSQGGRGTQDLKWENHGLGNEASSQQPASNM